MAQQQGDTMDTTPAGPLTSRRTLLRTGALGVVGAAFLAACGKEDVQAGISGATGSTTIVPPTVPVTQPSELALAEDVVQLSTLASLEILVADTYSKFGPKLSTTELRDTAARFNDAHTQVAEYIRAEADVNDEASTANTYLSENLVDPVSGTLDDDDAILGFMGQLESTIVATCCNAAGILTQAEWRQRVMTFGAASARRAAVLAGPDGAGAPTVPLYPLDDLIPGDAFLGTPEEEAEGS